MTFEPMVVIGMGADGPTGLGSEARSYLARAEVLAGGTRHLSFFPDFVGPKIDLRGPPASWVKSLKSRDRRRRTVVLSTGDPLYFGIGRLLLSAFPKDELLFLPHVSSVALAFARLKETCNDACVVSLHGRPLDMLIPALERREQKIAIFTDATNHPAAIAQLLRDRGLDRKYSLWICENLGSKDERVAAWSPTELMGGEFAPLNIVVLLATSDDMSQSDSDLRGAPLIGIPESALRHRGEPDGLITKREVRLLALCYLELHHGDVLWDVGAGSGSVSVEAARLSGRLSVFAVEKDAQSLGLIKENRTRFSLKNVQLVPGEAPEALGDLPDPDAVFIGGSGGRLIEILVETVNRLKHGGRLVVSCVTLETLSQSWTWLSDRLETRVSSVQVAHSGPLGKMHSLEPANPIFLVQARKP